MKNVFFNKYVLWVQYMPFLWLFTIVFAHAGSSKGFVTLCALSSLIFLFKFSLSDIRDRLTKNKILYIYILIYLYGALSYYLHGYTGSELRLLICIILFSITVNKQILKNIYKNISILLLISAFISFAYSTYQFFILNSGRVWSINVIPYATISSSIAVISLYLFLNNDKHRMINLLSFLLSLTPVILSQTRGIWFSFIICSTLIVLLNSKNIKKTLLYASMFFVISTSTLYMTSNHIRDRIIETKNEISSISQNNMSSSIGLRLQMWKTALYIGKHNFPIGAGINNNKEKLELLERGEITKELFNFSHYHNQYLNNFAKYGIVSLILLCLLFSYPFYLYKRHPCNASGMLLILNINYIIAALTDIPMINKQTLILYYMLSFLLSYIAKGEKNVS